MIRMLGLDQTCDVYNARGASGSRDVPLLTGVRCRLSHVSTAGLGAERAAVDASRRLLWGPDETIPPGAEGVVEGAGRWRTVAGTEAALRGPNGAVVYQRIDCERI
jgi:hypothetical protein